jgi:hypothetical protein
LTHMCATHHINRGFWSICSLVSSRSTKIGSFSSWKS